MVLPDLFGRDYRRFKIRRQVGLLAAMPPRPLFLVVTDYPRQAVDGRLRQLAKQRGWHLRRVPRGKPAGLTRSLPRGTAVAVSARLPRAGHVAIAAAVAALARNDMVFGPDDDGFYWLIGWSRRRRIPPAMCRPALDDALAAMPANFWVELLPSEDFAPLRL
jgi:hypothetical protein